MYLLITHMGTLLSVRELMSQWRTVTIAMLGILGIIALTMTIGSAIFGYETAVIATPPLTGGIVAAIVMSEAAGNLGLENLAVLAIYYLCYARIRRISVDSNYVKERR